MEEFGIYYFDLRKCDRVISGFCDRFKITPQEYDSINNNIKAHIINKLNNISYCELDKFTDIINRCRLEAFVAYVVTARELLDKDFEFGANGSDIYIAYKGQTIS